MHPYRAKRSFLAFSAAVLFLLTSCKRHAQQPSESNQPSTQPGEIWVSETTGKEYRVRVQNDVVNVEWLNMSPELAKHGAFIRSTCKKDGAKWVGMSTSYLPCTTEGGAKPKLENWCHLETEFEIDAMSPESITGRSPALIRFDCTKCQILQSEMKGFLLSPKAAVPK